MSDASLPDTPIVITQIGADIAMGLWYWPATRFGIIPQAARPHWTPEQRLAWIEAAGGKCPKCRIQLTLENTEIDHTWPLSQGGQNWGVNLRALCSACNKLKSDDIESVTLEALRDTVLGDLAAGAFTRATSMISRVKFSDIVATFNAYRSSGAAITVLLISPKAALLIAGGVVLVVAGYFAVKWLMAHTEGERQYVRLARSARMSLSQLARQAGGVAGQMRGRVGRAAITARDASSTHAPTIADHASQLAHGAGRASSQAARTASGIAGRVGGVTARRVGSAAGQVPVRAGSVAATARASSAQVPAVSGQAVRLAQGAAGRVLRGRFGRRGRATGDVMVA